MTSSPALILRFPVDISAPLRDRLVGLLAEHDLVAIHEDDIAAPRVWTAHFAGEHAREAAIETLALDGELRGIEWQPVDVDDEDWARRTQADLPAVRIGRIIVAPPWDLPKPSLTLPNPDITIVIEPSRGFGTGHHQSTRLCLALLQARELAGRTVLDIGTGSGVLAIAAAKLGAAVVSAIDTDPDAIENARENIATNGVQQVVQAHVDDLASTTAPPADLVTANLTGTLLIHHAEDLARLVRPSGQLIVSGFNVDESDRVTNALEPHFSITETAEEEGWWAFALLPRPR